MIKPFPVNIMANRKNIDFAEKKSTTCDYAL
jgi:hypothetical protein